MMRKPKRSGWGLILAVNIFIFLLGAEGLLRVLDLPRTYRPHSAPPQFGMITNERVFYLNVPDMRIVFEYDGNPRGYFRAGNQVGHTTNRQGFRTPPFEKSKKPGTVRVVFLGDSFTFGEGVHDEDVYPEQFRRKAQAAGLFSGQAVEVINLGVGGYNSQQEWALLNEYARYLNPDIVVVGYTLNDTEPYLFYKDAGEYRRRFRSVEALAAQASLDNAPAWVRTFRLSGWIWTLLKERHVSAETVRYYEGLYAPSSPSWQNAASVFSALAGYQKETGAKVYVVTFPLLYRLGDPANPFLKIHTQLHRTLASHSLSFVDLWPLLKKYRDKDLWVHPTDQHPNEIVHAIAAEAVIRLIGKAADDLKPGEEKEPRKE